MTVAEFGEATLTGTILFSFGSVALCIMAFRFGGTRLLAMLRGAVYAQAVLLSLASAALLVAILGSDFSLEYVVRYTERAQPLGYKLAAFWAGQAGSLLLWAWLVSVVAAWAVGSRRNDRLHEQATSAAVLAVVTGFFAVLMLFTKEANPFTVTAMVPEDGNGMNPMLQDPAMILHPPLLFLGYAGFTVPFAFLIGALTGGLARGEQGGEWIEKARRWVLGSWLFLTAGIVLGAEWAYVELGWGGYWAWDPVENASLLPWLTGTALIHSVMAQSRRDTMKVWNAALIALTFLLCIFGTFLTRSGVIASVHAYARSDIGNYFLVFLGVFLVASAILFVVAWVIGGRLLRPGHRVQRLLSRDAALQGGNVLLMVIMLTTLVGTIWPLLTRPFTGKSATLGQEFYNNVVVPMSLVMVALMGLGPLLAFGKSGPSRLRRRLLLPGIAAHLAGFAVAAYAKGESWSVFLWAVVSGVLCALVAVSILEDLVRTIIGRRQDGQPGASVLRRIHRQHRRIGGMVTHMGVVLLVAGVAGSSLFTEKGMFPLKPGDSAQIKGYTLTVAGLDEAEEPTYTAVQAKVTLTDGGGESIELRPERRFYKKWKGKPNSEVAVRWGLLEDVYLNLAGWTEGGKTITIQALVNPLVSWIWIGGGLMGLGCLICMLPGPARRRSASEADQDAAQGRPSSDTA